jgi:hypothetical protein
MVNMEISKIKPNAYFVEKPATFRWRLSPIRGSRVLISYVANEEPIIFTGKTWSSYVANEEPIIFTSEI